MSDAVALKVKIITGARDGPDLLVIGGVHGDEFESMAAIRRLIAAVDPLQLRGRLICIPVVNEPAYWRGQRTAEDELDLARALNMPIIWGTYPHLDGRTLSVARDAKVPAIYAEWMGGGVCDPAGVDADY